MRMKEWLSESGSLDIQTLHAGYLDGALSPVQVCEAVFRRIKSRGDDKVWIHLLSEDEIRSRCDELNRLVASYQPAELLSSYPLYGLPFAIKDNIDFAGAPTTAACPEYAYVPKISATAVDRLIAAGAILIGKTNLDQFALGLVGARSPYGVPGNAIDGCYLPGGSSSGSGVAVSAGLVSFALGTDTAGSGRVPASFNNIVGLKPTRGLVSAAGVVPACRTLDCVSVFALTCQDSMTVLQTMAGEDSRDSYSRPLPEGALREVAGKFPRHLRVGIPGRDQLEFFGNVDAENLFSSAIERLEKLGLEVAEINYAPFHETAQLVYGGPWMAERYAAIREFIEAKPDSLHPITRELISNGRGYSAVDAFEGFYRLEELKKVTGKTWNDIDLLMVPTTGTIYTIAEAEADPVALNNNLSFYTNFVNLLDLSALAVPNGLMLNGLPTGVTFIAPAFQEGTLCSVGSDFHRRSGLNLGATLNIIPEG